MSGRRSEAYLTRDFARFMPAKDLENSSKWIGSAKGNNTGMYGEGTLDRIFKMEQD